MYYPQGTRSKTPNAQIKSEDLKHGAFSIAIKGKFKILPVTIRNSHQILRPWGIADVGKVDIILGTPFEVKDVDSGKVEFCTAIERALESK